jgi:hypothetical protein
VSTSHFLIALEAAAVLIAPLALGACAGAALQRWTGKRLTNAAELIACLLVPTALAAALTVRFPLIGLYDGIVEGFLVGFGLLWTAHRAFADSRNLLLTGGSILSAFVLLELGVRIGLGPPPAYPIGSGPHFFLSTLLRTTGPDSPMFQHGAMPAFLERRAMGGNLAAGTMEERPPGAMITREIVCAIAYGAEYRGVVDVSRERAEVYPDRIAPRADATRRVLHVGDSMVYGANVRRDETFTVDLEKLEPDVQHINGGISGMAPDDYFVVLRRWVDREPIDLAVMYLFAGNDMVGLDAPHPCSGWESILSYEGGTARLRYPAGPRSDNRIGLRWLAMNSPLPFLGRAMIVAGSRVAAFSGAVLDRWAAQAARANPQSQNDHLESILRAARDELAARGVAFVVVVLPHADAIGMPAGPSATMSALAAAITQRLGIPLLDASQVIRDALGRGESPIQPDRSHFNAEGHRLIARWLHAELPGRAQGRPRSAAPR